MGRKYPSDLSERRARRRTDRRRALAEAEQDAVEATTDDEGEG